MAKMISAETAMRVLSEAPVAILVLNSGYVCKYANAAAESVTGVNTAEILYRSIWETFPSLQSSAFESQVKRAMTEGKRIPFEFHYASSAKWFDVEAVPIEDGVIVYISDSTERHTALDASRTARIGEDVRSQNAPSADKGRTVLLVDDDESMRKVTRRILARGGFNVIEAEHGADALRVAAEYPDRIDLLVTDVLMPGIRGPELVEELVIQSPNLRVLYMSGYTDEDITRWGLQPGMAFIHKPFTA